MKNFFFILLVFLFWNNSIIAKDPTAMQTLFTVKQVFTDCSEVAIFISEAQYKEEEKSMQRASAITQIKPVIYYIKDAIEIGTNVRKLAEKIPLIIYNSDVISNSSTKMYILKNAKDKLIPVIALTNDYYISGGLLSLTINEEGKLEINANLKSNTEYASLFTPETIEKLKIVNIIQ